MKVIKILSDKIFILTKEIQNKTFVIEKLKNSKKFILFTFNVKNSEGNLHLRYYNQESLIDIENIDEEIKIVMSYEGNSFMLGSNGKYENYNELGKERFK